MLYNKFNLGIARFAAKDKINSLDSVFFKNDRTVATDRFVLVEMMTPNDIKPEEFPQVNGQSAMRGIQPFLADGQGIRALALQLPTKNTLPIIQNTAIKHLDENHIEFMVNNLEIGAGQTINVKRITDNKFPDYEPLFPKSPAMVEISINGKMLGDVLEFLSKMNKIGEVKLKIYGENKAIMVEAKSENQSGRALIMPLKI